MNTLVRLGRVVPLEDGLFYAKETCDDIPAQILAGRKSGDRFTLPLLNRMEKDGLLRREQDAQVVR